MIIAVAFDLMAVTLAAPQSQRDEKESTQIDRYLYNQQPDGSYLFRVDTSDGTSREEIEELKEVLNEEQKPQKVIVVRGSYNYFNILDHLVKIVYIADENGFQTKRNSIATPPPAAKR